MSAAPAPLNKFTVWLLGSSEAAPPAIARQLAEGLFTSVPIFLGGVVNTAAVAAVAAWRHPTAPFIAWVSFEICLGLLRLCVLIAGRRRIASGQTPPKLFAATLSCIWAGSLGVGTSLCIASGDWVLSTIACLSAAAMVCGICLRNFGTPRLTATMVFSALMPCALAGLLSAEPAIPIIALQLPVFMLTIFSASFGLHRLLVSWMTALNELERSKSLNETILQSSPDHTLILDENHRIAFCKRPGEATSANDSLIGREWLSLVAPEARAEAEKALLSAESGSPASIVTRHEDKTGEVRWYDIWVNRTSDISGRLIVVSRDITHQKKSEANAVWMARHDALTGLPNRALLQDRLDTMLIQAAGPASAAMLILDVDNFKTVNDTLGHDAGDALLCNIARQLEACVADGDLVARTGGDEFALLVKARSNADVAEIANRILDRLREPLSFAGRPIECGASIGASFISRDGSGRSEIMKAADIALYAAKAGGRGQLRIFKPAMMVEVEIHQAMIASARNAIQREAIVPYYQPKISLKTSAIIGFEALLRWTDANGRIRGPDALKAAFDDPILSGQLSSRMLEKVLIDMEAWTAANLSFGHVAVNVTSTDLRRGDFAEMIIECLKARNLSPASMQIEVTENVFLGHGAEQVERTLRRLSGYGIRIALDDFGTGYASLSHLSRYPVNSLKIDKSFVNRIGAASDVEAISSTVINLGHCLGLEVVAEGIETAAQEACLINMGCDTGQGFLYSPALPATAIPATLVRQDYADVRKRSA